MLNRKSGDWLGLSIVEQPEILFLKSADGTAFAVSNHNLNLNQPYVDFEIRRHIAGADFRRGCISGLLRRRRCLREKKPAARYEDGGEADAKRN